MKELRSAIIKLQQKGLPERVIASLLDVPKSTVYRDIARFKEMGNNEDRKGRGRKRTARSDENIQQAKEMIKENPLQVNFIVLKKFKFQLEKCAVIKSCAKFSYEQIKSYEIKIFLSVTNL